MLKTILVDKQYYTEKGQKEFNALFKTKARIFQSPKSPYLISQLLRTRTSDGDVILDFFAGSGTTAHAVMLLNSEDRKNRKCISVQLPEPVKAGSDDAAFRAGYKTVAEIGKERIRRAGEKLKAELVAQQKKSGPSLPEDGESFDPESLDIGFKVFKTADTMIRWTYAALAGDQSLFSEAMLSDKEKLDFMPHFTDVDVAYEILLRQHDIPLSAKMEPLGKIGKRTWRFADRYVVCLEEKITPKLIEKLAAVEPTPFKYVFRDSVFEDDIALKDETLCRLAANVSKNTGKKKKNYTVEFL